MLVTINTDASFHPKLKYGAYAFWAICNDFKITKSGVFRKKCINSDDAEAKCILNALSVVLKSHKGITKLIINTDSLNATAYLKGDTKHINKYGLCKSKKQQFRSIYISLLKQYGIKLNIEFRHVKAHTNLNDSRSYVNEWCDSESKRNMWFKVNSLPKYN